jgi:hypothetical protein
MRCVILISALACAIATAAVHRNRAVSTDMPILTGAQIVAHGFNAKQGTEGLWPVIEFTVQLQHHLDQPRFWHFLPGA